MLRPKSVVDDVVWLVCKIGYGHTASDSIPFVLDVQDLEPNERPGLALEARSLRGVAWDRERSRSVMIMGLDAMQDHVYL
jgi:hypothetical protein